VIVRNFLTKERREGSSLSLLNWKKIFLNLKDVKVICNLTLLDKVIGGYII